MRTYANLPDDLNRQWDTAYGTWEEVIPPPARITRLKENVSTWLDFRIFLAEDVARRLATKQNGELPPGASASANVLSTKRRANGGSEPSTP